MKRILKLNRLFVVCMAVCSMLASCMPSGDEGSENGGVKPEVKPNPDGIKQISLLVNSGSLAGLYYTSDGFITSTNGWQLSSVGKVASFGEIDYIPRYNWYNQLYANVGEGFVAYKEDESFVRCLVAGMLVDDSRPYGIGLMYLGQFTGSGDAIEFKTTSLDFPAEGGKQTIELKGNAYSVYEMSVPVNWMTATATGNTMAFIKDAVEIEVAENTSAEKRTAKIVVRTFDNNDTVITVTQAGTEEQE